MKTAYGYFIIYHDEFNVDSAGRVIIPLQQDRAEPKDDDKRIEITPEILDLMYERSQLARKGGRLPRAT